MGKVFNALNKVLAGEQDAENIQAEMDADLTNDAEQDQQADDKSAAGKEPASPFKPPRANFRESHSEALTGVDGWDEKLVTFANSSSPLSENFRLLRTKILHPPSGKAYRKILVVSTVPGAGKSFVCANLGISIAQGMEQHALLVDCDLRRSRLASLFNCKASTGLVNYLQEGEDLGRLIVPTGMRKLSLIPSGPRPINPAELLGSVKVEQMFAELENRYDDRFIIIDTSPTLAASETQVLANHADGVILVVRWGLGGRAPVKQLTESLDPDKIIGVVFNAYEANMVSSKISGYEEYGQYAGGYGEY